MARHLLPMVVLLAALGACGEGRQEAAGNESASALANCDSRGPREMPARVSTRTSIGVDVDGDRHLDRFVVYTPRRRGTVYARFRIETAAGSVVDEDSKWWHNDPRILGATDINNDRRPEVWVDPKDGATAHHVGVVVFEGCRPKVVLDAVDDKHDSPASFLRVVTGNAAGGTSVGVRCIDIDDDGAREIVETETQTKWIGSPGDPEGWSWVAYRLNHDRARVVAEGRGSNVKARPSFIDWSDGWECDGRTDPAWE